MMTKLTATDGHSLDAWIEPAEGDRRGGIVIVQEIFGVTDQLKGVAKRYTALGYEVAIPALFDRQKPDAVIPFDQFAEGRELMLAAKLDQTMMDIDAARAALAAHGGKVGMIGFCWGGGLVLRAAQVLDVACAVSFYGTRLKDYLDRPLKAPVQGHFGKADDHTPPDLVAFLLPLAVFLARKGECGQVVHGKGNGGGTGGKMLLPPATGPGVAQAQRIMLRRQQL